MCTVEPRIEWRVESDDAGLGERLAASAVWLAVRLWCLPLLALVWILGWTAIGVIRGGVAVSRLIEAARGVEAATTAVHPGVCGPGQLGGVGEPVLVGRA